MCNTGGVRSLRMWNTKHRRNTAKKLFRVYSGSPPGGFRVGSGSAPGGFWVGFGCVPGRLRLVSGSAPGSFRVGSGWGSESVTGGLRAGSGQVGLDLALTPAAQNGEDFILINELNKNKVRGHKTT
jgi:hypothetical protein